MDGLRKGLDFNLHPNDKSGHSIRVKNSDSFLEVCNDGELWDELNRFKKIKPKPFNELFHTGVFPEGQEHLSEFLSVPLFSCSLTESFAGGVKLKTPSKNVVDKLNIKKNVLKSSLSAHLGVNAMTSRVLDALSDLKEEYPGVSDGIDKIRNLTQRIKLCNDRGIYAIRHDLVESSQAVKAVRLASVDEKFL